MIEKTTQLKMKSMQFKLINHVNPKGHASIVVRWATLFHNAEEAPESTTWMPTKEKTKFLLQILNHALMLPTSKLKLTCYPLKRMTHSLT
jgi:hypothetical protein